MANDIVPYGTAFNQSAPPPPLIDGRTLRPLRSAVDTLTREISAPTMAGVRSIISSHPAQGLDPARLTSILRQAETGNAQAYLELAEEMEEKYPHYLSVLGTRKRAVSQLPINVEAASEDPEDEADAQLVRDWLKRLTLQGELFDILDAIGKGFSVTEIVWELTAEAWLPKALKWRLPQFFEFDQVTGEQILLRGGEDGTSGLPQPLSPYKYIVHTAQAKSGLPIRGGLARGVAWFYLFTNYTLKGWMTFLEVYGLPLRVGKYQPGTSESDIRKLAQAVAQIGSDAGCVIPQSMMIEFVTSNGGTANPEMFQKLCTYADDQVSKAVLGQTSSSDAKAGGLGSGQADLHGEVRKDIKDADAMQLSVTLTRDVAMPLVMFNRTRADRRRYPTIRIGELDQVDVEQAIASMEAGVKMGVPIGISTYRKLTGIPEPRAGEALLAMAATAPPAGPDGTVPAEMPTPALLAASKASKSASPGQAGDAVAAAADLPARGDDPIDRATEDAIGQLGGLEDAVIAGATSLAEVKELLALRAGDMIDAMDVAALVQLGERMGFASKIAGLVVEPGQ
ncbi:DUF935 domain-containing protein [Sphingomonas sp. HMWF008]|nr:DUF935 domain-containing protein [Sphingomonas sp. HMWF008]